MDRPAGPQISCAHLLALLYPLCSPSVLDVYPQAVTTCSEQDTEGNEDGTYVVQDIRRFGQGGEESCQLDVGVFLKGVSA